MGACQIYFSNCKSIFLTSFTSQGVLDQDPMFGIGIKFCSSTFSSKLPRLPYPPLLRNANSWPLLLINILYLILHFNQAFNQAIFLCINTFTCLKINQYWTGLFVSYSVKTELHEIWVWVYGAGPSPKSLMRLFHPVISLVVWRNLWLILLVKFDCF